MAKGFRHGTGGDLRKVPVLDEAYPQDVTVDAVGTGVTFEAVIAEDGKPVGYTYQWYYDNIPVEGATGQTYTREAEFGSHTVYCIVTSEAGFVTSRTATVKANKLYLYKNGDKCSSVTGGWTTSTPSNTNAQHPTYEKTSPTMTIFIQGKWRAGYAHAKNKIDVTDKKKLVMNFNGSYSSCYCIFGIIASFAHQDYPNMPVKSNLGTSSLKTLTLDVSALSGSYYVGVLLTSGDGSYATSYIYDISEIYLE